MLHHLSAQPSPDSLPVFVLHQDDQDKSGASPTGLFLTIAEIRERYPADVLSALAIQDQDQPLPTFPDFMQLLPEQQAMVVAYITGDTPSPHHDPLAELAIYPQQSTDTITIYDMVAQRILATPEDLSHLHSDWLYKVQQQGYPSQHPLYQAVGISDADIMAALQNWPELPVSKRRDLDWHNQHLAQNLRHLQVAVYANPPERDILVSRLQAHNISVSALDETPDVIVTNNDPYDTSVFVMALKAASQAKIPLYIAHAASQASDEHAYRLRITEQVLHEVRSVYQGEPVEHSFTEVQATIAAIINTSSQPKQQDTLL